MEILTPSFGLIFWMVLIFGTVFFLLAKFGFPTITKMMAKRSEHIARSLKDAEEAKKLLAQMDKKYQQMMQEARKEQGELLDQARKAAQQMIDDAKGQASTEAAAIITRAREEIEQEKKEAVAEIRNSAVNLSIALSEKILREKLSSDAAQNSLIQKMVNELGDYSN